MGRSQRTNFDIVGGYDNQRISTISAQRTINMFEFLDPEGKKNKTLLYTSGIQDVALNLGSETGGCRASFVFMDAIYNIYGQSVFRTTGPTGALVTVKIGTLTTSAGFAKIDANTFQVIFVDGEAGYIYDTNATANPFQRITDSGFPTKPLDVCYLDGFFIVIEGDTNIFRMSSLYQGMVWSGGTQSVFTASTITQLITLTSTSTANFATGVPITFTAGGVLPSPLNASTTYYAIRVSAPDVIPGTIKVASSYDNAIAGMAITLLSNGSGTNTVTTVGQLQEGQITSHPGTVVACNTLSRRIFFFSQNFTEVWENAGLGTNLPVRRNNSLLLEVGTPSAGSVSVGFDRMFFLAQDRDGLAGIREVQGSNSAPVSNRALDYQLAQYAENALLGVSDARGILIKENGIIFYRLNFTNANHTFVLNVSMSTTEQLRWHEEEVLNGDRHPAQTHAYYLGNNYYGAYNGPIFYRVEDQDVTNNGEAIRRVRIGREMTPEGYNRIRIDRFQLDLLQGQESLRNLLDETLTDEDGDDLLTENEIQLVLDQTIQTGGGQPEVFLSYSKDGGQTYGPRLIGTMGKIGERTYRTVWRKLGVTPRGQGFIPKIEFFGEIQFIILGAAWDFEILPE